jgi:Lrp/AsnC family transcriptional regulator for asnA, asnC and gidA
MPDKADVRNPPAKGDFRRGSKDAAAATGTSLPKSRALVSPADGLNRAIVRLLQDDGRRPFKEIAKSLGVSEGTVRNRVNWMTRAGMLRIVAIADPTGINYKADAMLGIKVAQETTPQKVAERFGLYPEVVYILWVSGRFDLLVEVVSDSEATFRRFLETRCYGAHDIANMEVMTGLAMFKNQFLLKQNFP